MSSLGVNTAAPAVAGCDGTFTVPDYVRGFPAQNPAPCSTRGGVIAVLLPLNNLSGPLTESAFGAVSNTLAFLDLHGKQPCLHVGDQRLWIVHIASHNSPS